MKSFLWLFLISFFGAANAVNIDFEDVPVSPTQLDIPNYSTYGFIVDNTPNYKLAKRPLTITNSLGNAFMTSEDLTQGRNTLSRTKYASTDNGLFDLCSINLDGWIEFGRAGNILTVGFIGYRAGQEVASKQVKLLLADTQNAYKEPKFQKFYFSDFTNIDKLSWIAYGQRDGAVSDDITAIPRNGKHQCPKAPVCILKPLDMSRVNAEIGYAYINYASFGGPADISLTENRSTLQLYENGVLLSAHTFHTDIRTTGKGRFSHWSLPNGSGEALRFTATDNSNPKTNGRQYTWCVAQQ